MARTRTTKAACVSLGLLLACVPLISCTSGPVVEAPHFVEPDISTFVDAAHELPPELVRALERDLGITGPEYLAAGAALSQANEVVQYLATKGIDPNDVYLDGVVLKIADPNANEIASAVGAAIGTPFEATPPAHAAVSAGGALDEHRSTSAEAGNFMAGMPIGGVINGSFQTVCTAGLNGHNVGFTSYENWILTSGDCVAENPGQFYVSDVTAAGSSASQDAPLGAYKTGGVFNEPGGIALIGVPFIPLDPNWVNPSPNVATWSGGTGAPEGGTPVPVRGTKAPVVGAPLCKSSPVSGWTCGQILAVGFGQNGNGFTNYRSFTASVCTLPTETGAPGMSAEFFVGIARSSTWDVNCVVGDQSAPQRYTMFLSYEAVVAGDTTIRSVLNGQWEPAINVPDPVLTSAVPLSGKCQISGTILAGVGYKVQINGYVHGEYKKFTAPASSTVDGTWVITADLDPGSNYQLSAWAYTESFSAVSTHLVPTAC
ncbi:hypothetical protein [Antiquaquibacter soli]|uniref:Trypsin-like serine protease n=1 Tax=Antiquaquibacter soli TaxID=3064523 RepID=A0ABT9BRF6_9MICO|nr:hypothetical protein [Protaetiibacter sp. WY-16]MDO7883514.1 hypothetical protein [Protaetiibacter sp. WY-16]